MEADHRPLPGTIAVVVELGSSDVRKADAPRYDDYAAFF
jgi:hypothetical protein